MTVRIGIGGPIGCGKSTVAGWLGDLGATVVDADELARDVTVPGEPAADAILDRFGSAVAAATGGVDRAALAAIVFADPEALSDLEAIVHPAVRRRIEAAFATAERGGAPAVVVEAIRLAESGLAALCDEVWSVECSPADQRARLIRRGMAEEDIERRMAAQVDLSSRLRPVATRIVDASGERAAVRARVANAYAESLAREA